MRLFGARRGPRFGPGSAAVEVDEEGFLVPASVEVVSPRVDNATLQPRVSFIRSRVQVDGGVLAEVDALLRSVCVLDTVPVLAAVEVTAEEDVRVHLVEEARLLAPWRCEDEVGTRWSVRLGDCDLDDGAAGEAPYPMLAALGTAASDGAAWFVNLRQLPALRVVGDVDRSHALVRHLVAQTALNPWADSVCVVVVGLPADGWGSRVHAHEAHSPASEVVAAVRDSLAVSRERAVLVIVDATAVVEATRSRGIVDDLVRLVRAVPGQVSVVTIGDAQHEVDSWTLRLEASSAMLEEAGLSFATVSELSSDDAVGAAMVLAQAGMTTDAADVSDVEASLDRDLADWFDVACTRPRLQVLGTPKLRAWGTAPPTRSAYFTEIAALLTLRRANGLRPSVLGDLLGTDVAAARRGANVVRKWLGSDAEGPYLPDAQRAPAAAASGVPVYQVSEGVLCDWDLMERLVARADRAAQTGKDDRDDLRSALRLVSGTPFSNLREGRGDRTASRRGDPWQWLYEGDRIDLHACRVIAATGLKFVIRMLETGDVEADQAARRLIGWVPDEPAAVKAVALVARSRADQPPVSYTGVQASVS